MFDPIFAAPLAVQIHILCALPALLLGPVALLRRSRDGWHKIAGRLWVAAMAGLALSSFAVHSFGVIGPFSPIHLLSVWVLVDLWRGVADARAGRIAAHGARMRGLYMGAMGIAGLLTLLPGRVMNRVLFPEAPLAGLWAIGLGAALLLVVMRWQRRGIWMGDLLVKVTQ